VVTAAIVCLALNIYHEARGEPVDGQIAVAQVTLNRVASPDYPDTVCEVVYDHKQFSWTINPPKVTEPDAYELAFFIASNMDQFDDFTQGALYYYTGPDPYWASSFELVGQIGNHKFMKP
jgi:cell wall hydrolase